MGRHSEALADAEGAVKCDPAFVKGYLRRATAHQALENWEDALRDFEKVRAGCLGFRVFLKSLFEGFGWMVGSNGHDTPT
jgi:tetratricopeptide (TPR) repeat protein